MKRVLNRKPLSEQVAEALGEDIRDGRLKLGQMLSHVIHGGDEMNVIVEGFTNTEKGILINTKPHKFDVNDFTHLEDRDIIGGII